MKRYDNTGRIRTCLSRYGFEHPMQDPVVRRRSQRRYSYSGVKFDSSYELALYIWLADSGLDFEYQPSASFEYLDGTGARHFYQPDFRVEGFLYEVKGKQFIGPDGHWRNPYNPAEDHVYEAKRLCCAAHGVKVITDCDEFLDYVSAKYGKGFISGFRSSGARPEKPSKADSNPYFRNRKLDLKGTENNVYRKRDPEMFDALRSLVEAYPKTYQRKLDAVGKRRELEAGIAKEPPYARLKRWVRDQLPLLDSSEYSTTTKVAWILLGMTDFPKCAECGKSDGYIGKNVSVTHPYGPYCCRKCAYESGLRQEHAGDTKLERYGSRTYVNAEKAKETVGRKKAENPGYYVDIVQKRRDTCMEAYGVDNPMKCDAGKCALSASNMEKYGVPFYTCLSEMHEKTSETCMREYGAKWFVQTERFRKLSEETRSGRNRSDPGK